MNPFLWPRKEQEVKKNYLAVGRTENQQYYRKLAFFILKQLSIAVLYEKLAFLDFRFCKHSNTIIMAHSALGNLKKEPTIIGFFFTFNHKWKVINQAIKERVALRLRLSIPLGFRLYCDLVIHV